MRDPALQSRCAAALLLLMTLSTPASHVLAQTAAHPALLAASSEKMPGAASAVKNPGAVKNSSRPAWQELSPLQQTSLKPLAADWNTLGESQKRKWIAIAANYPKLAPTEQEKLHSRMTEWVSLSQRQREQARLNFAQSKQLTSSQKAATWSAYQALSPEEKQRLATSATPKPVGAATATKPVPQQKLATVPVNRQTQKQAPKMAAASHAMDRNTLLPQSKPQADSTPMLKN